MKKTVGEILGFMMREGKTSRTPKKEVVERVRMKNWQAVENIITAPVVRYKSPEEKIAAEKQAYLRFKKRQIQRTKKRNRYG